MIHNSFLISAIMLGRLVIYAVFYAVLLRLFLKPALPFLKALEFEVKVLGVAAVAGFAILAFSGEIFKDAEFAGMCAILLAVLIWLPLQMLFLTKYGVGTLAFGFFKALKLTFAMFGIWLFTMVICYALSLMGIMFAYAARLQGAVIAQKIIGLISLCLNWITPLGGNSTN